MIDTNNRAMRNSFGGGQSSNYNAYNYGHQAYTPNAYYQNWSQPSHGFYPNNYPNNWQPRGGRRNRGRNYNKNKGGRGQGGPSHQ
jgi:hypothetical protein